MPWWSDSRDGDDPGTVHFGRRERGERPAVNVILCFLATSAILVIWSCLSWFAWEVRDPRTLAIANGVLLVYLLIAYFLHPDPNTENYGWQGTWYDDPLTFSDDFNRFLFSVQVFLWPGRFLAESIVDMIQLLIRPRGGKRKMVRRRRRRASNGLDR